MEEQHEKPAHERQYGTLRDGLKAVGERSASFIWSRGYLPHFEGHDLIQHVCFRLADSLPRHVVDQLASELKALPPELHDEETERRVHAYLDAGRGSCVLSEPEVGELMTNTLKHFHAQRYRLHAWCVMPNHVHVLFQSIPDFTKSSIVWSWKSFTGRRINEWRKRTGLKCDGAVWHREYYDRFIRDHQHYTNAVEYIHMNPVKAGLVRQPEDWRFSSARVFPLDVPPRPAELQLGK